MKTRYSIAGSVLIACAALLGHGCADDRASIQIQGVCAPPATCAFSGECEAKYISWPVLDVTRSAEDALTLYLQVANQLSPNANEQVGKLNTADAHVDTATVDYDPPVLPKFTRLLNQHVPAGASAVIKVEVTPPGSGGTLAGIAGTELVGKLRFQGYYDDGTRFETGEFPVAVRICAGCLTAACGGGATCPPNSEGQLPLTCVE